MQVFQRAIGNYEGVLQLLRRELHRDVQQWPEHLQLRSRATAPKVKLRMLNPKP